VSRLFPDKSLFNLAAACIFAQAPDYYILCVYFWFTSVFQTHLATRPAPAETRICACGCGGNVSASTERRHLGGKGPRQVAAAMHNEDWFLGKSKKRKRAGASPDIPSAHSHLYLAAIRSEITIGAAIPQSNLPGDDPMDWDADLNLPGSEEPDMTTQSRPARRSTRVTARAPSIEQVRWRSHRTAVESSDSDTRMESSDSSDSLTSDESDDSDTDSEDELGGLTAWELLGEEFEREAHSLGT